MNSLEIGTVFLKSKIITLWHVQCKCVFVPTGEKECFKCFFCTFTSVKLPSLRHHLKTHSEEKRHVCHLCPKAFRTASLLHNHVNTHTGRNAWKYCMLQSSKLNSQARGLALELCSVIILCSEIPLIFCGFPH